MPAASTPRWRLGLAAAAMFLGSVDLVSPHAQTDSANPLSLRIPADIRVPCNRADDTQLTGLAEAEGGCGGTAIRFTDSVPAYGGADTVILRIWTGVDSCGETQIGIQKVTLQPIHPRIAVLPLENLAESEEGSRVLVRLLQNAILQATEVELISPGTVESGLLRARIRQPFLMEDEQRRRLGEGLEADYFLIGSLLAYETFDDPYSGRIPVVDCSFQLVTVSSGKAIWSETLHAVGSDGEWLFGLGVEHDITRLSGRLADKAVHNFMRVLRSTPCLISSF
ncbi:MAG: hypothetical protein AB1792_07235 [Candidatus Zixiibacteriota bacterium]